MDPLILKSAVAGVLTACCVYVVGTFAAAPTAAAPTAAVQASFTSDLMNSSGLRPDENDEVSAKLKAEGKIPRTAPPPPASGRQFPEMPSFNSSEEELRRFLSF